MNGPGFGFEKRRGENPWLDFLRSVAVLLVLMRHGQRAYLAEFPHELEAADYFALNGWVGVDLFLVLSGYLIARQLIGSEGGARINLSTYFFKRVLRIAPAYFAVLALIVIGAFPGFEFPRDDLSTRVFYHMLFLQDYLPSDINVVFWSLGVEEKFYIAAPLIVTLLAVMRARRLFWLSIAGLLLVSPLLRGLIYAYEPARSYPEFWATLRSPFHATLDPLIAGVAISFFSVGNTIGPLVRSSKAILFCVLSVMVIWFSSHEMMAQLGWFDATTQPLIIAIGFGAAVWACTRLSAQKLFGEYAFLVISRLSYSLYLVHYPLLPLTASITKAAGGDAFFFWGFFLSVSFIAALMLHFLVERPFLLLRDALLRRSLKQSVTSAASSAKPGQP